MLDGLHHLAQNRMVHRDVKPANVMLVPATKETTLSATVKLVDIGLGRELFDEGGETTHDLSLTREGAILGTPDYLAPEQARDARNADIRSDIYSAGCVLYQLITGRTPFGGTNVMAQMVMHATEHAPRLADYVPDVPAKLQIVMDRLLAKDPADRFQSPAEAETALQAFLPKQSLKAEGTQVLPAFQEWLAGESNRDMPVAAPAPKKASADGPFGVELVVIPDAAATRESPVPRGWLDLDRRDWVLLAAGFVLSSLAIGAGYGLARWFGAK
jgi:serine/threonine protein kinase